MALFIQSANSLVSRISQWVGAIPTVQTVTATAINTTTGVLTTSANPSALILVGDFIGPSIQGPFAAVIAVSSTTVTVNDPDGIWSGLTAPVSILKLPTQSSVEIMSCIQMCELKMRTIELPALRSDPYDTVTPAILTTNAQGMAPIPSDMNSPILFFQDTSPQNQPVGATNVGPWIVYDRVGDREIIRRRMIDQL